MVTPYLTELVRRMRLENPTVTIDVDNHAAARVAWYEPDIGHPLLLFAHERDLAAAVNASERTAGTTSGRTAASRTWGSICCSSTSMKCWHRGHFPTAAIHWPRTEEAGNRRRCRRGADERIQLPRSAHPHRTGPGLHP
jgi:hypothetical protein